MKRWNVISGVAPTLFVATILTLGVTTGIPSAADAAPPCKGPNKNDPGCPSGNDPGAEIPVVAMFDCSDPTDRACPNSENPHRVQGDGLMSYMDGAQDVTAHIRESGVLQLRTDAKGQKPGERNIYWDFGSGLALNSGTMLTTTDDLPEGSHLTIIQVGRGVADDLDIRTLTFETPGVTDTAQTNLWANLAIQPNKGSKEWVFIRFEDPTVGDQCPDGSGATTVTVTRLADVGGKRRWEIVGAEDAMACIQDLGVDKGLGPFRFVAQEK